MQSVNHLLIPITRGFGKRMFASRWGRGVTGVPRREVGVGARSIVSAAEWRKRCEVPSAARSAALFQEGRGRNVGKRPIVDEERPKGNSTSVPCRYCGNDAKSRDASELRLQPARYQVIVACASCGAAFAALSRN